MVIQTEIVRVNDEVVLRGNSAMLKCAVPSYVADFVTVDAWLDDRGGVIMADGHIGNHPPDPPIPPAPLSTLPGRSASVFVAAHFLVKCH